MVNKYLTTKCINLQISVVLLSGVMWLLNGTPGYFTALPKTTLSRNEFFLRLKLT